jgi:hypothetical protein
MRRDAMHAMRFRNDGNDEEEAASSCIHVEEARRAHKHSRKRVLKRVECNCAEPFVLIIIDGASLVSSRR